MLSKSEKKIDFDNISISDIGLEERTLETLRLINNHINVEVPSLNEEQKNQVRNFLTQSFANMELNKKVDKLKYLDFSESGIGHYCAGHIRDFTFRTRHLASIQPIINQLWSAYQEVINDPTKEYRGLKLTLEGYGMLHDLAKLNATMEAFQRIGVLQGDPKLEQLLEDTRKAKQVIEYLDKNFEKEFKFPAGSVVVEHTESKAKVQQQEQLSVLNKSVSMVSKYGHSSTGVSVERAGVVSNQISHINPTYEEQPFNFRDYLYCDVYAINLENLMSPQAKAYLQKHLGPNYLEQVQAEYYAIERTLHDKARMMHYHIRADSSWSTYADVAMGKVDGHRNTLEAGHNPVHVHREIYGAQKWQEDIDRTASTMLCSEFTGKTMIASVKELNNVLINKLRAKGVTEPCPDPLVKSPISSKVRLQGLDPASLIKALKDRNAVTYVTPVSQEYVASRSVQKAAKDNTSFKDKFMDTVGIKRGGEADNIKNNGPQ